MEKKSYQCFFTKSGITDDFDFIYLLISIINKWLLLRKDGQWNQHIKCQYLSTGSGNWKRSQRLERTHRIIVILSTGGCTL